MLNVFKISFIDPNNYKGNNFINKLFQNILSDGMTYLST